MQLTTTHDLDNEALTRIFADMVLMRIIQEEDIERISKEKFVDKLKAQLKRQGISTWGNWYDPAKEIEALSLMPKTYGDRIKELQERVAPIINEWFKN